MALTERRGEVLCLDPFDQISQDGSPEVSFWRVVAANSAFKAARDFRHITVMGRRANEVTMIEN